MVSCGVVLCGMVWYDLDVVRSFKCVVLSVVVWYGMEGYVTKLYGIFVILYYFHYGYGFYEL
jgi:hypothetical protein